MMGHIMWCDQDKWVWSLSYDILSFLIDVIPHLESYILQETPLKSDKPLQSYEQLNDFQNNR